MQVSIKDFNYLKISICSVNTIFENITAVKNEQVVYLSELLEDSEKELNISNNFLNIAKIYESEKFAVLLKEEAELAQALQEEAAAFATGNPAIIAAASAYVAKKTHEVFIAKEEYNKAQENRYNMERRVETATNAKNQAELLLETSKSFFDIKLTFLERVKEQISIKLNKAYDIILGYYNNKEYIENLNIIMPDNLSKMLFLDKNKSKKYFEFFYKSDVRFKQQVDKLKEEYHNAKTEFEKEKVILKIRRNLAGAYAEKYIETSLSSLGKVQTQHIENLHGSYSKVDILIKDIKKPIILGKGKCKHLKKGDTLAIEIKAGSKDYIKSQKEHLKFQTAAHKKTADVSVIITSKDIYELQNEEEFRKLFKEDCSHILALLPKKNELDRYILESMELV